MIQEAKWWVFVVALRLSGDFIMEINRYIPQIPPRKRPKRPQVVNNPVLRPDFFGGWHWGYPTRRCCSKPPFNQSFFSTGSYVIYFIVGCTMLYNLLPSPPQKKKINQGMMNLEGSRKHLQATQMTPKNWNSRIPAPTSHHSKSITSYRHYTIQLDRCFYEAQSRLADILGCVL